MQDKKHYNSLIKNLNLIKDNRTQQNPIFEINKNSLFTLYNNYTTEQQQKYNSLNNVFNKCTNKDI
jgi:hypothetical protein